MAARLEPLSGYLQLGAGLFQEKTQLCGSWNFGPAPDDTLTVGEVAEKMHQNWDKMRFEYQEDTGAPHEAAFLRLDCSKAEKLLNWRGVWNSEKAIYHTVRWYQEFCENRKIMTADDLASYCRDAEKRGLAWTK